MTISTIVTDTPPIFGYDYKDKPYSHNREKYARKVAMSDIFKDWREQAIRDGKDLTVDHFCGFHDLDDFDLPLGRRI